MSSTLGGFPSVAGTVGRSARHLSAFLTEQCLMVYHISAEEKGGNLYVEGETKGCQISLIQSIYTFM
jgi:hypothetical protein